MGLSELENGIITSYNPFMDVQRLQQRALEIREKYRVLEVKKYGKEWTNEQIVQGFVGDVGDLIKLVMAKSGIRSIENVDEKLRHELADCLWALLVISAKYKVDLEKAFTENMDQLDERI